MVWPLCLDYGLIIEKIHLRCSAWGFGIPCLQLQQASAEYGKYLMNNKCGWSCEAILEELVEDKNIWSQCLYLLKYNQGNCPLSFIRLYCWVLFLCIDLSLLSCFSWLLLLLQKARWEGTLTSFSQFPPKKKQLTLCSSKAELREAPVSLGWWDRGGTAWVHPVGRQVGDSGGVVPSRRGLIFPWVLLGGGRAFDEQLTWGRRML